MHSSIGRFTIGLLAVAATAFVACGGGDDDGSATSATSAATQAAAAAATQAPAAAGIGITLSEWGLTPDESSAGAGEITFAVTNDGGVPHEFVVVRTDEDPSALPLAAGSADEASLDIVGRSELIQGGASESVTFTLSAGNYVLICNVPAHYSLGMSAAFTVQ